MKIILIKLSFCCLLMTPWVSKGAVSKSPDGSGDLHIFPYYSTFNKTVSQLRITNNTNQTKAIKIRISPYYGNSALYNFNIYLNGNHSFGFVLTGIQNNFKSFTFTELLTNSDVCALNFNQPNFGTQPSLVENGQIEIIEMGTVDASIVPSSCAVYENYWQNEWAQDPRDGLAPPSGGVVASINILNVNDGINFSYEPMVFNDFFEEGVVFHTAPEEQLPGLSSGSKNSLIMLPDRLVEVSWPTGHEALSALFTKTTLSNQFSIESFQAGATEWIISFPTIHHYSVSDSEPFVFTRPGASAFPKFNFPGSSPDLDKLAEDVGIKEGTGNYRVYDNHGSYFLDYGIDRSCTSVNGVIEPAHFSACINAPPDTLIGSLHAHQIVNQPDDSVARNFSVRDIRKPLYTGSNENGFPQEGRVFMDLRTPYSRSNLRGKEVGTDKTVIIHGLPLFGLVLKQYFNSNSQPNMLGTFIYADPINSTTVIETIADD